MITKAVSYCRVSTTRQGQSGLGLASQREIVLSHINRHELNLVGEFTEVESGGKTDADRPQLHDALRVCRKLGAVLVVAKLDRLSRNAEFLLRLQNAQVEFVCCDCPNVDRFTIGILALVAQRERELISERTRLALKVAKERGKVLGTPQPLVQANRMALGRARKVNATRDRVLPLIGEIKATGITTLQGIADCLNRRGVPTSTGRGTWFPSSIKALG
jgi:DNA invertase Pin-like site-specific DNA recombinase